MRTRFAPSLTGYLHLGHVLHLLYVWKIAQSREADVLCRMEDHDRSRARPDYEPSIFETLDWLGFVPDSGMVRFDPAPSVFRQSDGAAHYESVLETLRQRGWVYGCACSRKQIAAAQSAGAHELCYSGTCCEKNLPLAGHTVRLRIPEGDVVFDDLALGEQRQNPRNQCGDFSLRDRQGQWTYQFACVCDDIRQGIDLVVRGEDILFSTARQIQLFKMLAAPVPQYYHHPLLCDAAGKKLSKRQRSESVTQLREAGASAEEIIGRAAWAGRLIPTDRPLSLRAALSLLAV